MASPITINVAGNRNFEELTTHNSPVTLAEDRVLVGENVAIRLAAAQLYEPQPLTIGKISVNHNTLRRVAFILGVLDVNLSVLDPKGITQSESKRFARTMALPLREPSSHGRFEREALALVGLGTGFTPSGDDLLAGFLATWNTLAGVVGRAKIFLSFNLLTGRTSWISAKLLDYMQRQLLDSQLAHLIDLTALGSEDEFLLAIEGLLSRGHTSGLDLSTGLTIALSLIMDISAHTQNTEGLLNQLGL
jgi:hypothetical protein